MGKFKNLGETVAFAVTEKYPVFFHSNILAKTNLKIQHLQLKAVTNEIKQLNSMNALRTYDAL